MPIGRRITTLVTIADSVNHRWTRTDTFATPDKTFSSNEADTAADTAALTFALPRAGHPYPASGSFSRNLSIHITAGGFDKTVTRAAKVTFDGSSTAVLQVGALTCSLDLVTGVVSGCH